MVFHDRHDAGRQLAERLMQYAARPDALVLALPRGGLPVAAEVSAALHLPLDLLLVRKLGLPGNEELAVGAVTAGGEPIFNQELIDMLGVNRSEIDAVLARERQELRRREALYRDDAPPPWLQGQTVLLVDDGLATGATMRSAIRAVRGQNAARVVMAVPVAAESACAALSLEADECVCLSTPEPFQAVSVWYEYFPQVTDDEVRNIYSLARHQPRVAHAESRTRPGATPR